MTDNIQRFYDKWSQLYDSFSSNRVVQRWRRESIESLGIENDSTVVDVGCGTGANAPVMVEQVGSQGEIVCVDVSRGALEKVDSRVRENSYDNVHPVRADGNRIPVSNPDVIYASFSVAMFPNPLQTVDSWIELVGEGGKIGLLNVVKSERGGTGVITNKPLQFFTGLTLPTDDVGNKLEQSVSGEAFEQLDSTVRSVHERLYDRCTVIEENEFFNGSIYSIAVEVKSVE